MYVFVDREIFGIKNFSYIAQVAKIKHAVQIDIATLESGEIKLT